ncbi:MAG: type II toxin-antitoxin system HicA family toxin [Spirochaetota bacterium]
MSPQKKRLTPDEMIKILSSHGFEKISQKGSHQKWKNYSTGKQVIVPFHKGKQLPIGTLNSIIEGSGISRDKWY